MSCSLQAIRCQGMHWFRESRVHSLETSALPFLFHRIFFLSFLLRVLRGFVREMPLFEHFCRSSDFSHQFPRPCFDVVRCPSKRRRSRTKPRRTQRRIRVRRETSVVKRCNERLQSMFLKSGMHVARVRPTILHHRASRGFTLTTGPARPSPRPAPSLKQ